MTVNSACKKNERQRQMNENHMYYCFGRSLRHDDGKLKSPIFHTKRNSRDRFVSIFLIVKRNVIIIQLKSKTLKS